MKRTISVNIKGTNFIIEEDGYELLNSYLQRLEQRLKQEEGSKEIIEDIEYRIAELFNELISERKTVIEQNDVENTLKTLGEPEDYVEGNEFEVENAQTQTAYEKTSKRLFRDVENGKLAGVCSGLAAYFNTDVILIRILFLIVFFFGAFSIPLYIILWIVTPKATSNIDRLRMQGKPINIDNVKEEVSAAADRFKSETTNFAQKIRQDDVITQRFKSAFKIIGFIVGIGLLITAVSISFSLVTFGMFDYPFIPADTVNGTISISTLQGLLLESSSDIYWMRLSVYIIGFSTVIFLILIAFRLLFNLRSKLYGYFTLAFFIITIGFSIFISSIGIRAGIDLKSEGEIEKTIGIVDANELIIQTQGHQQKIGNDFRVKSSNDCFGAFGITLQKNNILENGIHIIYLESQDSLYHIYQRFSAQGASQSQAIAKAKNINFNPTLKGNELIIPSTFSYPKRDKIRDQEVSIVIAIPSGKKVKINHQSISLEEDFMDLEEDLDEFFDDKERRGYINSDGTYTHDD